MQARIVDAESGEVLRHGQEGVLELKGGQLGTGDSWLRTTDRAVIDEDRFLFIRGRADNAIIRGGFKIHPDDIVRAIESHSAVREAAIVGVPDERLGEVPAAAIILKEGAKTLKTDHIRAYLRDRLVPYQVPVYYRIVDDIPRTPSMKPATVPLKKMFASPPEK